MSRQPVEIGEELSGVFDAEGWERGEVREREEWNCGIKWNKIAHGGQIQQIHEPRVESIIIMDERKKTFFFILTRKFYILYFPMLLKHKYTQHETGCWFFKITIYVFVKCFPFCLSLNDFFTGKFISRVFFCFFEFFHAFLDEMRENLFSCFSWTTQQKNEVGTE